MQMNKLKRLPFHGANNVRDLGGYPISDHAMSAWNICYRADGLSKFDEHDWLLLKERNVGVIIDLRSIQECQEASYDSTKYDIEYAHLPIGGLEEMKKSADNIAKDKFLDSMKLDYVSMVERSDDGLKQIFTKIASVMRKDQAILFHCSAGKDRTGIVATFLLDLIHVNELDIIADYQVSATYLKTSSNINLPIPKELLDLPQVKALLGSDPQTIIPLIDYLHKTSSEEYLLKIGVSAKDLATIKKKLVEKF